MHTQLAKHITWHVLCDLPSKKEPGLHLQLQWFGDFQNLSGGYKRNSNTEQLNNSDIVIASYPALLYVCLNYP